MTTKRVFVAIDLSDDAINAASSHIGQLKRRFPHVKARWIRPENLHVTLRFAGNIEIRMVRPYNLANGRLRSLAVTVRS